MRYALYILIILPFFQKATAQVGIGVTPPHASAQLHVQSTSKGMLVPRMTAEQRGQITTPAEGLLVYQTDGTQGFHYYNGSAWVLISNNLIVKNGGDNFTNSLLIGHQTTGSLSGAERNLGIGAETLKSITSGYYNLAIGMSSLSKNTTGYYNLGVGTLSLSNMTTGNNNVAVGAGSLFRNTDGYFNTAVGNSALYSSVNGALNTAVGMNALYANTGYQNVAIGYNAGYNLTTGTNNIMIGYDAQPSSADAVNEVTIGNSNNDSYRMFGNLSFTGMTNNGKTVLSNATITSAALNNYNVSNVSILFVAAGGVNDVYGLSGGVTGQVIHIFTKDATLYFHHNGSSGTQKFALQATIVINPNDGVTLVFDGTNWRMTRNFMAPPA